MTKFSVLLLVSIPLIIAAIELEGSVWTYITRASWIAAAVLLWFETQRWLALRGLHRGGIADRIHLLTSPAHAWLRDNPRYTRWLLVSSSAVIDIFGITLILVSIFGESFQPFVALILLFSLRQMSQFLCELPPPEGMVWFNPGVPSLLVTYETENDFFFSGHTAIAVLAAIFAWTLFPWWIVSLVLVLTIAEMVTVLVLRAHYSMDVIAAILAAIASYFLSNSIYSWIGC